MKFLMLSAAFVLFAAPPLWSQEETDQDDWQVHFVTNPHVGGLFLEYNRNLEHRLKGGKLLSPTWTYIASKHFRLMIFDPDNEELASLRIPVERGARLTECLIRITNPDEEVREFGSQHLVREQGSGGAVLKFAYPGIRRGSHVEVSYTEQVTAMPGRNLIPPLHCDELLQFTAPCKKLKFSYTYPMGWQVQVKRTAEDKKSILKKRSGSREKTIELFYEARDVPAIVPEPFSPTFKELAQYAEIEITSADLKNRYYKAPKHWGDLAKNYKKYVIENDGVFARRGKRLAKQLTKDLEDPVAKLDAIVTYVQKNISLNGGADPGNFADVLKTGKGNALVNTALTLKLARNAGLKGRFLLIHSADDGFCDRRFISFRQFYLPAVIVSIKGREYVVFPYIDGLPITHTPEPLQGQPALQIAPNGYATITEVPSGNLAENDAEEFYELTLHESGAIRVVEKKVLNGAFAFVARKALKGLDDQEQNKAAEEMLTYSEGDVSLVDKTIENLDEPNLPLVMTLTYDIDNLLTVTPDEILFNTGGLLAPISSSSYKVSTATRRNPIVIPYNLATRKQIRIKSPDGWRLTDKPEDVSLSSKFGQAKGAYRLEDGVLIIDQKLSIQQARAPKEAFTELIQLLGTQSKLAIPHLFFEPAGEGEQPDPDHPE